MALDPNVVLAGMSRQAQPVTSLLQGVQAGQNIMANLQRQKALEQQLAIQQEKAQRAAQLAPLQQQAMQQKLQSGALDIATRQANLELLGVPDETTAKQVAFDVANLLALPKEQRIEAAKNIRDRAVENKRSTGNIDEYLSLAETNPEQADKLLEGFVDASEKAGYLTPDTANTLKQEQLKLRKQELALKQDIERRQSTKLSAPSEKALLMAQDAAVQAGQNATEFDILANQIRDAGVSGGLAATTSESLKQLLGTQDDVTEWRRRFNKVRLSEGLKNLPPGPATDRDVQEAFKGVPPENAPASQIESFLRGAAKMARFDQAYNEFKSDYITQNNNTKGLVKAWKAHAKTISKEITGSTDQDDVSIDDLVSKYAD